MIFRYLDTKNIYLTWRLAWFLWRVEGKRQDGWVILCCSWPWALGGWDNSSLQACLASYPWVLTINYASDPRTLSGTPTFLEVELRMQGILKCPLGSSNSVSCWVGVLPSTYTNQGERKSLRSMSLRTIILYLKLIFLFLLFVVVVAFWDSVSLC